MNNSRVVVAVLAMVVSLLSLAGCERSADASAIRKAYTAYRLSHENNDGAAYTNLITQESIARYGVMIQWALTGKKADIKALEPMDKLEIIRMRAGATKKMLQGMDGAAFCHWHIAQGWGGDGFGVPEKIVDLRIDGDTASGELAYEVTTSRTPRFGRRGLGLLAGTTRTETVKSGVKYYFMREGGAWKIDEIKSAPSWDATLINAARDEGMHIDEYIHAEAEMFYDGDKLPQSVWDRMLK